MNFLTAKPSALLAPYIKQFWAIDNCLSEGKTHTQRIIPSGMPELMIYTGALPVASVEEKSLDAGIIVSGQQKGFYDLKITRSFSLFSITFQPYGMMMFFDIPLSELYDRNIPLQFILKDYVSRLEDTISEAATFYDKVESIEKFLTRRLLKSTERYGFKRIKSCIDLITNTKGLSDIKTLASQACLSRKQFERVFSESIGASPRQFLKTVRFQNAINYKAQNPGCSFTSLAYNCGFYDQPHMNNEFKKLSGMTPGEFFAECEPVSDYFR